MIEAGKRMLLMLCLDGVSRFEQVLAPRCKVVKQSLSCREGALKIAYGLGFQLQVRLGTLRGDF